MADLSRAEGGPTRSSQHVASQTIYTIGHSTRTFDQVLLMLRAHDITALVDVRSFPRSRKHPQWNQEAMIDALPPDIAYRWVRELGGRRHTPAGTPSANDAWEVKAFRDYADYMESESFRVALDELVAFTHEERVVIMCSEAVPWRCHRRLITDALLVAGVEVVHVMSTTATKPGALTPFARVQGAGITYPQQADTPIERVARAVRAIPPGHVASYGDIGAMVDLTPRQVGRSMSELDDRVPWWRVVYADGTPATCHDRTATALLIDEQTPMIGTRVDMRRAR